MLDILSDIKRQIKGLNYKPIFNFRLSKMFKKVNDLLKGSDDTLIKVYGFYDNKKVYTNLLNDDIELISIFSFKELLIEWLESFRDDMELLYDIFIILLECKIIVLNDDIRLILFNRLYNSGYFSYVAIDSPSFKDNYLYIKDDLKIISIIVSNNDIKAIDDDLTIFLSDLYLFDNITLKDLIIG